MRHIAERAGVHFSTVSLSLRNNVRIPKATRERIQALAHEMGYLPDPVLGALMAYRHGKKNPGFRGNFAWLNCHPESDGWKKSQRLSEYYEGACESAGKLGYGIEEFWYFQPGVSPKRLSEILLTRGIAGILLTSSSGLSEKIELDWDRFAVIALGYGGMTPPLKMVSIDQQGTCSRAIQEMVKCGYTRIGMVLSRKHDASVEYQYTCAFHRATRISRLCQAYPVLYAEQHEEAKIVRWLKKEKPRAILSMPYYPWKRLLAEAKLSQKPEICLLSTSGSPAELTWHRMVAPGKKVGSIAVSMLDAMIRSDERGIPDMPSRTVLEGDWVSGNLV